MINGIGQSNSVNFGKLSTDLKEQTLVKPQEQFAVEEKAVNVNWSDNVEFWIEDMEDMDPEFLRQEAEIFDQLDQLYGIDYSKKLTGADANRENQLIKQLEELESKESWTEADFAKEEELMLEIDKLYGFDPNKELTPEQLRLEGQLFDKLDLLYEEFFGEEFE